MRPCLLTTSASKDSPGRLFEEQVLRAAHHQHDRHGREHARPQRPLVVLPNIRRRSWRDLDRLLEQDLANERGDPRVLRVKAMRADVEMEVAVMEGPAETANHVVTFDDGDLVSPPESW